MEKESNIYVFYHLFLVERWRDIWKYHRQTILESGLYDNCREVKVGVVYKNPLELEEFRSTIEDYPKITTLYCRNYNDLPVTIWNSPKKVVRFQLGEGETIFKMAQYAKTIEDAQFSCLFFHSKGVTKPDNKRRSQMSYFYSKGLSEDADPEETQDFILQDMTEETVVKWEEKVNLLQDHSFYFYIWNFFWVAGQMLKDFDFAAFNKRGKFPKMYKFKDRHQTAIFPMNLYEVQTKEDLGNLRELIGYHK